MGANAVTTVPVYVAGEVLTAADLNITNSGIPVFADSTARDNSFGGTGEKVLAEGQFAYIEATDQTQYYSGTSWLALGGKLGQVVSTTKTDTFTTTSATFTDITGLSLSITPSSATSKILVIVNVSTSCDISVTASATRLMRDSTAIAIGDAASLRISASSSAAPSNVNLQTMESVSFFDSPATTSATTYKMQIASLSSGQTAAVNRSFNDADSAGRTRTVSTITALEILA
jgi:hypothetical protein